MELNDCIIIIALIVIIYLLYKTRNLEGFATTTEIENSINSVYNADLSAMRNLGNLANDILTSSDTLKLPANVVTAANNMKVQGDLVVDGSVKFTNKNMNLMDIFPQFMVIAWANTNIPKGWAQCDGSTYKYNEADGTVTKTVDGDSTGIKTPDLRGRFIMGSGNIVSDNMTFFNSKEYKLNDKGGEDVHKLTINELPIHSHKYDDRISTEPRRANESFDYAFTRIGYEHIDRAKYNNTQDAHGDWQFYRDDTNVSLAEAELKGINSGRKIWGKKNMDTQTTGNDTPHNNLPPYYVMIYIMKL